VFFKMQLTGFEMNSQIQYEASEKLRGLRAEEERIRDAFQLVIDGSPDLREHLAMNPFAAWTFWNRCTGMRPTSHPILTWPSTGLSPGYSTRLQCFLRMSMSGYHSQAIAVLAGHC